MRVRRCACATARTRWSSRSSTTAPVQPRGPTAAATGSSVCASASPSMAAASRRTAVRPAASPSVHCCPSDDKRPHRGRPGHDPHRPAEDPRGGVRSRGRCRGARWLGGRRRDRACATRRGADGHPHAGARWDRGDAAHHTYGAVDAGADPDDVRPRHVCLRLAALGRERFHAEGRATGRACRGRSNRCRGRCAARACRDTERRGGVRSRARAAGRAALAQRADAARARSARPTRARVVESGDLHRARDQRGDDEDARRAHPAKARSPRPRAGGDLCLRERARPAWNVRDLSHHPVVAGRAGAVVALGLMIMLAGCGGGGPATYTYNFASSDTGAFSQGVYIKLISPVKIDPSEFKGDKIVDHVSGPKACSITQTVKKPPPKYADLEGKQVTIEIYGTNPLVNLVCGLAKKGASQLFKP